VTRSVFNHRRGAAGQLNSQDSFTRTNSTTSLGSTDGNGTVDSCAWTIQGSSTGGIISNQGYFPTIPISRGLATLETQTPNIDARVTLSTVTLNGTFILFRFSDTTHYWYAGAEGGFTRLYKINGVTTTQVGTDHSGAANGDIVRVILKGSSIELQRDQGSGFVSLETATDTFNQTATKHGIFAFVNTAARFDDWLAYSL
jgi:hypothetical protein